MLRTFGIPTRKLDRDFGGAESLVPNHFSHVWINMPALLDLCLHHAQFAGVLDQALWAGIAADHPLKTLADRHLAPWPAFAVGQGDVDECAFAGDTAPAASRMLVG